MMLTHGTLRKRWWERSTGRKVKEDESKPGRFMLVT